MQSQGPHCLDDQDRDRAKHSTVTSDNQRQDRDEDDDKMIKEEEKDGSRQDRGNDLRLAAISESFSAGRS